MTTPRRSPHRIEAVSFVAGEVTCACGARMIVERGESALLSEQAVFDAYADHQRQNRPPRSVWNWDAPK